MAKALQHNQTALIARILSTTRATDDEPVPDTARSGRANAIVSPSRWYKKSVRPKAQIFIAFVFTKSLKYRNEMHEKFLEPLIGAFSC
jgi:hypothetical protein